MPLKILTDLFFTNRLLGARSALDVAINDSTGTIIDTFGGTTAQVGAAFPATVNPIAVKDNSGLVAPITLTAAGKVPIEGTLATTAATASTSALTNVAADVASQTILAANANRLSAFIVNDSDKLCYVKFGTTASATSYTKILLPGQMMDVGIWIGRVDAIWEAAVTGAARVTELTA